ncbi:MAG: WG repeat-containing protein [Chitinophagaceae bacterium]|nr:WG repeat-containing protein [Chitinophagaceae bacterium]
MKKILHLWMVLAAAISCSSPATREKTDAADAALLFEKARIGLENRYEFIDTFDVSTGLAVVRQNDVYGFADSSGQLVVPMRYTYASSFTDELALVTDSSDQFSFIDKSGRVAIELKDYDNAFPFVSGYAAVRKGDKYGLIDKAGKEIMPCQFEAAPQQIVPGTYILVQQGKTFIGDLAGKPTLAISGFGELYYDEQNKQYAMYTDSGWVLTGPDGALRKRLDCDGLIGQGGLYFVNRTGIAGTEAAVLNAQGEPVVPYGKYDNVNPVIVDGLVCVAIRTGETPQADGSSIVNQKVGFVDATGKEAIPLKFKDFVVDFSEGLCAVGDSATGKLGYIDTKGNWVIPPAYTRGQGFLHGFAKVWTDEQTSFYIDRTGKRVQ